MSKSLISNEKVCCVCGTIFNLHKHHIYGGANRSKSEKYGCWCYLCATHHNMSDQGVHFNRDTDLKLKQYCEEQWLKKYDKTTDDFIREFGRNYL